jgi:hypothetical protein
MCFFKKILKWFFNLFTPPVLKKRKTKKLVLYYSVFEKPCNLPIKETVMLVLTDSQFVELSVAPVNKAGNPAKVDGAPKWSVSDAEVLELVVADDGLSAKVVSKGKVGVCQVNVSADADLGDGVAEIAGVLDIEVKAGPAVSLGVSAGAPQEK